MERDSKGPLSASQLAAVVQHLQVPGSHRKLGRVRIYCMEPGRLAAAEQWLRASWLWERRADRFGEAITAADE